MKQKAQSTLEYVVLICLITLALVSMNTYLKRGIQGRLAKQADEMSNSIFYAPRVTKSFSKVTKNINETSKTEKDLSESKSNFVQKTLRKEIVVPLILIEGREK